jgi:sialic acid synthase
LEKNYSCSLCLANFNLKYTCFCYLTEFPQENEERMINLPYNEKKTVSVIAEIGCNHKGNIDIAKELIFTASQVCKADVVKFQKRNNNELLSQEEYNQPHPVPENSYGETYGLHREFLEFDKDQHKDLMSYCSEMNITYSTSVWDLASAKEMSSLNPEMLKIPSATNQNFELQNYLCEKYQGNIHVSTGMSTLDEIEKIVSFYNERERAKDLVLYSCTSGYPVEFRDVCLLELKRLMEKYGHKVGSFGFSGHHLGIAADISAATIGHLCEEAGSGKFTHIERHFTLDRTWKGTDHAASLEPDGLRRLARDLNHINESLNYKDREILEVEQVQRSKLKWKAN